MHITDTHNRISTLSINLIYFDCMCVRAFFYPNALQSLTLTAHTHTSFFFHPLIPNCLRKRRGEIPLQCLGSAVFGNHLLSHTVVGGRRREPSLRSIWYTLWHMSRLCCQRAVSIPDCLVKLNKHPGIFFFRIVLGGWGLFHAPSDIAFVHAVGAARETDLHKKLNWKVFCLDSDVLYFAI